MDLADPLASRRRVALRLLPRRVLRGPLRRVREPGLPLAAGAVLEPDRLERRVRPRRPAQHLARRSVPDRAAPDARLRLDRDGARAARRLPGRVLRVAPRWPVPRARPARPDRP